ncbi:peptidoglycan editing factor PgeF [Variovorax sp. LG9.2]|nr:peptidoglycan editing factor PgeF [Variovorax sp. LG9.2]
MAVQSSKSLVPLMPLVPLVPLVPDWPAPANVRALCTTRAGGVSTGPCASLNLGEHVGDAPEAVIENRSRLRSVIGVRPVFLRQVHGTDVAALDADTSDGSGAIAADACTTTGTGIACTIMVADCMPVLFTDEAGERVAAAHAGWRGLAAGVLERTLGTFTKDVRPTGAGTQGDAHERGASKIIAWLGPCIGPKVFEVGSEVKAAFEAHSAGAASCFEPGAVPGKWLADLPALARQRLRAMGVEAVYGNDGSDAWCTVSNSSQFFSYRREAGSGRFAALIWKV